jgi:small-conductance mechanosensitive channel
MHKSLGELLSRLMGIAIAILGFLISAVVVFPTFRPGDLIAGLGITTVAIGFAFKEILQNFFAGVFILWREPFVVGDEIRTLDYEGTVENITTRSTRIRTYDGERAVIPNGEVYTRPLLVRTAYKQRRVRIPITLESHVDVQKVKQLIENEVSRMEGVAPEPGPWVHLEEMTPGNVVVVLYFWTGANHANVLFMTDRVLTALTLAFERAGIRGMPEHAA